MCYNLAAEIGCLNGVARLLGLVYELVQVWSSCQFSESINLRFAKFTTLH